MINWSYVNSLQKQKLDKEIELDNLLKKDNVSKDEINELKSEILYLGKQIKKIVGSNEIKRQNEIKIKKFGINQKKLSDYYAFKDKYKKINKMNFSVKRFIKAVDEYNNKENMDNELVRVKI